jgi:integrase
VLRFLTVAEVRRLAVAVGPGYRALILLGADGGLRIGEMAGLRRKRLDLAAGVVEVAEVVTEMHGHLDLGPPKTSAGRRRVGLPRCGRRGAAGASGGSVGRAGWLTLDRYGHLYPEADRALRDRLDRFHEAAGDAE